MRGFHIDMNVAQFTRGYLEKWLRELSRLGYDAVLWEVENNIRWETCPECVSPDAFSKEEFREILGLCRDLGLASIPPAGRARRRRNGKAIETDEHGRHGLTDCFTGMDRMFRIGGQDGAGDCLTRAGL